MPKLPDFLESTNFRNPVEPDNGLLQYANNTKLSTMDWFKANPKELEIINRLMVAMTMKWRTSDRSALSSLFPQNTTSDILIVDVGGGQGVAMEDLRIDRPDLKGQMIFQDLPEVIIGRENIAGVEAMGYDFFGPQPVKGRKPLNQNRHAEADPWKRQVPMCISSATSCTIGLTR